MCGKID